MTKKTSKFETPINDPKFKKNVLFKVPTRCNLLSKYDAASNDWSIPAYRIVKFKHEKKN